jgi:hypothetical protein
MISIFWKVIQHSPGEIQDHFGGMHCLLRQGRNLRQDADSKQSSSCWLVAVFKSSIPKNEVAQSSKKSLDLEESTLCYSNFLQVFLSMILQPLWALAAFSVS